MIFTNRQIKVGNSRNFYVWLNKVFNARDEQRLKLFGPDRTCAEWILRNGGIVKFVNEDVYTVNYNNLPPEGYPVFLQEVDASNSSIAHYGFNHFDNCKYLNKFIMNNCSYILDDAIPNLRYLQNSLVSLQISSCLNITDNGLKSMPTMNKLKTLMISNLPYVKNKEEIVKELQRKLNNCHVSFS